MAAGCVNDENGDNGEDEKDDDDDGFLFQTGFLFSLVFRGGCFIIHSK